MCVVCRAPQAIAKHQRRFANNNQQDAQELLVNLLAQVRDTQHECNCACIVQASSLTHTRGNKTQVGEELEPLCPAVQARVAAQLAALPSDARSKFPSVPSPGRPLPSPGTDTPLTRRQVRQLESLQPTVRCLHSEVASDLVCPKCRRRRTRFEAFQDLSLDFVDIGKVDAIVSLDMLLANYFANQVRHAHTQCRQRVTNLSPYCNNSDAGPAL